MARRSNRIKNSFQDKVFESVNFIFVTIVLVITLYPLLFVVSASFSNPDLVATGQVWLFPKDITIEGYRRVFVYKELWGSYLNTIFYAVGSAMATLFLTMTAAYALSKDEFPGKKIILLLFTFTMFFSGGLIPYYLIVKGLGLYDKIFTLPILGALSFYYVVIARTFIKSTIPKELFEAANMDGCSHIGILLRIVLPLSKPIIVVLALYAAVNQWNGFFNALIFISSKSLRPLQIVLREILTLNSIDYSKVTLMEEVAIQTYDRAKVSQLIKYAVMIVSSLPIIMFYPFIQKYFVKGIMIGSVKG